ncbi:MAG: alanine--glyoxylate aminotransferase [Latescibacteria bacterium DG_63]|nr:MAG: alanine--glyoxylate aminotransferase [Latescibacteria bacterium DG_63]
MAQQHETSGKLVGKAESVHQKHRDFLFPSVINYYRDPLVLAKGTGRRVMDIEGNKYLDFFGGILTVSVGHSHPRVCSAVKEQIDKLSHTSTLYQTVPIVELAETLAEITPGELKKTFFTASGTEADETAVMLAQVYTGRQELIALRHGYSGRSLLAQSLTAHAPWRALPTQVGAVKHAVSPYCYRCAFGLNYPSCEVKCAEDIDELIRTTTTGQIAGFLAEPIQGVGGFITPPKEYFKIAVEIVRRNGGIFICDEVQTGFGRTGGKMFGIEHYGVLPEIMTMAKGVANGLPLGVTIATPEVADSLNALTISTFGGNPVCCAASSATLGIIRDENIPAHVEKVGSLLRSELTRLKEKYSRVIGDVRGMGLMQAIELVEDETVGNRVPNTEATLQLFEETRERRLLIGKGGLYGNVIRISPPMTVTSEEIEEAVEILHDSFAAMKV